MMFSRVAGEVHTPLARSPWTSPGLARSDGDGNPDGASRSSCHDLAGTWDSDGMGTQETG